MEGNSFTAIEYVLGAAIATLSGVVVKMAIYITQQAEARRVAETEILKLILPLIGKLIEFSNEKGDGHD